MDGRRIASAVLLIIVLAVVFYPSFAMGVVTLKITDSGALLAEPLYTKYSNIALHRTGEGDKTGWIELTNVTGTYDLSSLRDTTETVFRSRITIGRYDKIRYTMVEATAVLNASKVKLSIKQAAATLELNLVIAFGEERILLIDFKTNSNQARINRVYENSPTVTVLK